MGVFHVFKIVQIVTKSRNASHIRKTALSIKLFMREKLFASICNMDVKYPY